MASNSCYWELHLVLTNCHGLFLMRGSLCSNHIFYVYSYVMFCTTYWFMNHSKSTLLLHTCVASCLPYVCVTWQQSSWDLLVLMGMLWNMHALRFAVSHHWLVFLLKYFSQEVYACVAPMLSHGLSIPELKFNYPLDVFNWIQLKSIEWHLAKHTSCYSSYLKPIDTIWMGYCSKQHHLILDHGHLTIPFLHRENSQWHNHMPSLTCQYMSLLVQCIFWSVLIWLNFLYF